MEIWMYCNLKRPKLTKLKIIKIYFQIVSCFQNDKSILLGLSLIKKCNCLLVHFGLELVLPNKFRKRRLYTLSIYFLWFTDFTFNVWLDLNYPLIYFWVTISTFKKIWLDWKFRFFHRTYHSYKRKTEKWLKVYGENTFLRKKFDSGERKKEIRIFFFEKLFESLFVFDGGAVGLTVKAELAELSGYVELDVLK